MRLEEVNQVLINLLPLPLPLGHSAKAERKEWRKRWLFNESGVFPFQSAWMGVELIREETRKMMR